MLVITSPVWIALLVKSYRKYIRTKKAISSDNCSADINTVDDNLIPPEDDKKEDNDDDKSPKDRYKL